VDVLLVSVGATTGWGAAARELQAAFALAGARAGIAGTGPLPEVRTFMLTDLVQARAARGTAAAAIAQHRPRALVYCSITAALLWPAPGAIWLDALAAENRPGRHGVWQRRVERRRLRQAQMVLTMSPHSLDPLGETKPASVLVPTPVDPSGTPAPHRDIDVLTYAGNPQKKRLEFVLKTWGRARRPGEKLVIAGIDELPNGAKELESVELAGRLDAEEYRALLRRTRVFLAAPKREDYGIAPLEALADGCVLVTSPAPGPYAALHLARELDASLVGEDLVGPLRSALDDPRPGYAERALELLKPFRRAGVDRTLATEVIPRLTSSGG